MDFSSLEVSRRTKNQNDLADEQKRNRVFLEGQADTILLRITTSRFLGLIRAVERDESAIREKQMTRATELGVDPFAYGDSGSNGKRIIENASGVRLDKFLEELHAHGYRLNLTDSHVYQDSRKPDPTQVFHFTKKVEGSVPLSEIPEDLLDALVNLAFNGVWVHANANTDGRLDSISCWVSKQDVKYGQKLVFAGAKSATYGLVKVERPRRERKVATDESV
jgi:hypothetical protein